tara:strand:+ start:2144 stop:3154 length:1011 start_codon:yes stop_codon:yes gene_type:complete
MSNRITMGGVPLPEGEYRGLKKNILLDAPKTAADYSARMEDLPINTPSLINRDTKLASLKKNMKVRGGFDGALWQAPRAGRVASTGEIYIFDGDHSKHLFMFAYPDAKTMPVQVIDVESKEEIHKLFVQTNATCKTPISSEQIFVHNYHAGDESVVKYATACKNAGLYVYCSHEDGGVVGDPMGTQIRFGHLKAAYQAADDPQMLTEAKNLIMKCKNPLAPSKIIAGPLLRSLCILFSTYPQLRPRGECGVEFEQFFLESAGNKVPDRFGSNIERDCRSGFPKSYRMAAGLAQEIVEHQKNQPGTFLAVSKGAQKRLMVGDLKRRAKKGPRKGSKK